MDVIIPRTAFRDIDDLARHVADNISLKTTAQTHEEILERTGGKQTIRVLNIEAQREALPLRRLYEADIAEPLRALQVERVQELREAYQKRKREIAESDLPREERLQAGRTALRSMRSSILGAYRGFKPHLLGEWLTKRREQREQVREVHERHQRHRQDQEYGRQRQDDRGIGDFVRAERADQSQRLGHER